VPLSLPALHRAIELNGVAVGANLQAFALGRLAAADPAALRRLTDGPLEEDLAQEPLDALIARQTAHLTAWQNAAWGQRYAQRVQAVRARESALGGDGSLTRAVAQSLAKLMSYKDEYEVARLYTDGSFAAKLADQFDGTPRLRFHMAPPFIAKPRAGQPPQKVTLGAWMMPALKLLARCKGLRGGALDFFGKTEERRMERELIAQFEARVDELVAGLSADKLPLATQIASVPLTMRGFGHVKLANVALARAREAELLHRFDAARYPAPAQAVAGQFKGIEIAGVR